jgi:hypothetical protein
MRTMVVPLLFVLAEYATLYFWLTAYMTARTSA